MGAGVNYTIEIVIRHGRNERLKRFCFRSLSEEDAMLLFHAACKTVQKIYDNASMLINKFEYQKKG